MRTSLGGPALAYLLDQERKITLGAFLRNGLIPRSVSAIGVIGATVKSSPLTAPSLNDQSLTSFLRTPDPCIDGPGGFARGVVGTGEESPELSVFDDHRASAFFTLGVGLHWVLSVPSHLFSIPAFGIT